MGIAPSAVMADESGNIIDNPSLLMLCNRAGKWSLPKPGELIPLPAESELFLLPGRRAAGLNPRTGKHVVTSGLAVAAFAAPGHTLSATPAYQSENNAPMLPLFAYGAVGYARGKFWVSANKVDNDPRQQFSGICPGKIEKEAKNLLRSYPENRLVGHIINNCVRRYSCPAARNFALGRYEAPLPTSRACNASCIGCISAQREDSPIQTTPQCRLAFTPSVSEIMEVMRIHETREKKRPIYSFGQGCEGDPLLNAELLAESIRAFRNKGGHGTINCNSNASQPRAVAMLAEAGLTSLRVSLNSAITDLYNAYYRPKDYSFADVRQSIREARERGVFVSLNLLYFPGITDRIPELDALAELCGSLDVNMIQLRNLNIDPEWYAARMHPTQEQSIGLAQFMEKLGNRCPKLRFGYFNPYLGDKAETAGRT